MKQDQRINFMQCLQEIASHSSQDVIKPNAIKAQGASFDEHITWLKSLENEFDIIASGADWQDLQRQLEPRPDRYNSPMAFIDTLNNNPHKAELIIYILKSLFHPTNRFYQANVDDILDTYLLKHLVEDALQKWYRYDNPSLGDINNNYVSNGDVKGAMLLLGYQIVPGYLKEINWHFNTASSDFTHFNELLQP